MGERVVERTGLRGLFIGAAVFLAVCLGVGALPASPASFPAVYQTSDVDPESPAETTVLHPKAQYDLFKKVLFYERSLKKRLGDNLVICILYESGNEASLRAKNGLEAAVRDDPELGIDSARFESTAVDLDKFRSPGAALKSQKADFLYITPLEPKTEKAMLNGILHECQVRQIPTFTGTLGYVDAGVALGFGMVEGRPQIKVNLSASKAQGLVFSAQFLKRAGII